MSSKKYYTWSQFIGSISFFCVVPHLVFKIASATQLMVGELGMDYKFPDSRSFQLTFYLTSLVIINKLESVPRSL